MGMNSKGQVGRKVDWVPPQEGRPSARVWNDLPIRKSALEESIRITVDSGWSLTISRIYQIANAIRRRK